MCAAQGANTDLEDLLAELDMPISKPSKTANKPIQTKDGSSKLLKTCKEPTIIPTSTPNQTVSRPSWPGLRVGEPDDLDQLLVELEDVTYRTSKVCSTPILSESDQDCQNSILSKKLGSSQLLGRARCTSPTLGNATDKMGYKFSCDQLRCIKCDFQCQTFTNKEWNGQCDYLFFRNYMPDKQRLSVNLDSKAGVRSYCCQCSWISLTKNTPVSTTQLKWVCGGHVQE
ncbi:hypothetical protein BDV3_000518 [Batrachochytrium dendrobatidis]|nr:hypothetical protein QVD99_008024 [Batrachochytrium dendrobatidis]